MSVEEEIKAILVKSPIERGGDGLPVSLTDIANHFNVPQSVVEDLNDGLPYYLHKVKVDMPLPEIEESTIETHVPSVQRELPPSEMAEVAISSKPKRYDKYNPEKKLMKAMEDIDEALIKKAKAGNVKAIEHFNKILGRITEKAEVKIGKLTAEDIFKRNLEAERDLKQMGYRVRRPDGQVLEDESSERTLLLTGVRLDTEQEHGTEGEVGTVAVPE